MPYFIFSAPKNFKYLYFFINCLFFTSLFNFNLNVIYLGYKYSGYGIFFFVIYCVFKLKDIRDFSKLNNALYIITFLISVGVIFDFNFSILDSLKYVSMNAYEGTFDSATNFSRRVSFFLGSSSLLYIVFIFPVLIKFKIQYSRLEKLDYIYIITTLIATFLSGSRLSLISLLIYYTYMYYITLSVSKSITSFVYFKKILFFFVILFVSVIVYYELNSSRLLNVFSNSDPGNLGRLFLYSWFYDNYLSFDLFNIMFGYGYGFLNSNINNFPSTHFESSLISMLIENGVFGLFLYLSACLCVYRKSLTNVDFLFFIIFFVNLAFVPCFLNYVVMFSLAYVISSFKFDYKQ